MRTETSIALDADLIREWHSKNSADEAARALGLTPYFLLRQWRRLKATGALPEGDRPRNRSMRHRLLRESGNGPGAADGRPSVDHDALLEKLKEVHGGEIK
jgi:hypothetical protein